MFVHYDFYVAAIDRIIIITRGIVSESFSQKKKNCTSSHIKVSTIYSKKIVNVLLVYDLFDHIM